MSITFNWRAILLIAALLIAATPALFGKRRIGDDLRSGTELAVPSAWSRLLGSKAILKAPDGAELARFRVATFESPAALIDGPTENSVLCVYEFDVSMETLVFDTGAKRAPFPVTEAPLKHMVFNAIVPVRRATSEEIRYAIATLKSYDQREYESRSVPTIDLGVFQVYGTRKNVIARLEHALTGFRGDGAPFASGGL